MYCTFLYFEEVRTVMVGEKRELLYDLCMTVWHDLSGSNDRRPCSIGYVDDLALMQGTRMVKGLDGCSSARMILGSKLWHCVVGVSLGLV